MIPSEKEVSWLDFSGAPPVLIPRSAAASWRGTTHHTTGEYQDLNPLHPVTDYDRACAVASREDGILDFMGVAALVLYTEFDSFAWDTERLLLAHGGWLPSAAELTRAQWAYSLEWYVADGDLLLINPTVDFTQEVDDDDSMAIQLAPGVYIVEYAEVESDLDDIGAFHRFTRRGNTA